VGVRVPFHDGADESKYLLKQPKGEPQRQQANQRAFAALCYHAEKDKTRNAQQP